MSHGIWHRFDITQDCEMHNGNRYLLNGDRDSDIERVLIFPSSHVRSSSIKYVIFVIKV